MLDIQLQEFNLHKASKAIAQKKISSEELTRQCINLLKKYNFKLNCIATLDSEKAIEDAKKADKALFKGNKRGLLHGIPLAHKDMFYRENKISSCGSKILKNYIPKVTATSLKKLDESGAIDVGRLQMVEFAYGLTGHNEHYGAVHNPWNLDYIPGGSSSGPASSVAAKLIFGALGSDTGGSIRFPSSCCGIVGMKPTYGRVSRFGTMPLSFSLDHIGPLTRSVCDSAMIMQVISGYDSNDFYSSKKIVPNFLNSLGKSIKNIKMGIPRNYFNENLHIDIEKCIFKSLDIFKKSGIELIELEMPKSFWVCNSMVNLITAVEGATIHSNYLKSNPDDYGEITKKRLLLGFKYSATDYLNALNMRSIVLDDFVKNIFDKVDVLITPVMSQPVPSLKESNLKSNPLFLETINQLGKFTRPFNYIGLPSISLPAGITSNGLPTNFQLITRSFEESILFKIGYVYEIEANWKFPKLDA